MAAAPTAVPTFHCIGVTWVIANGAADNECLVEYKVSTDAIWSDGMDLWWDPDDSEYRGSIVGLDPGTTYDIRLTLNDTLDTDSIQSTTLSETFSVGATTYLPLTSSSRYNVTTSGSAGSYRLYTFDPANGSATIDTARSANDGGHGMYIDANYVIIRTITIKNSLGSGIYIANGRHDIVIEYCDIYGFGDGLSNTTPTWDGGIATTWNSGIYNVTIQRNKIHDPGVDVNSWCEPSAGTHPDNEGPYAISMQEADSRWIIRYNSIYSTGNFFADGITNAETADTNHNQEIYGNYISACWDDAIQMEGHCENIRIWANYIDTWHHTIAMATFWDGPGYVWRNICKNEWVASWCDYSRGGFLKTSQVSPDNNGKKYVFHNTMLWDTNLSEPYLLGSGGTGGAGIGSGTNGMYRIESKNNILQVRDVAGIHSILGPCGAECTSNNDLYNGDVDITMTNGIDGTPTYDPAPTFSLSGTYTGSGVFTLSSASDGKDDGVVINNFTDGYEGAAPDMGAHEYGAAAMEFGVDAYLSGGGPASPANLRYNSARAGKRIGIGLRSRRLTR